MTEITYDVDKKKYAEWMASIWRPPLPTKVAVGLTIALAILLFVFDHWLVVAMVAMSIVLLWVFKAFSHVPPPKYPTHLPEGLPGPLRFDEEGLHSGDLKGPFKWSWCELSDFEVRRDEKTNQTWLHFNAPNDARFDRVSRWVFRHPSKRLQGRIPDIYEAPLEEIASRLNEYRRAVQAE